MNLNRVLRKFRNLKCKGGMRLLLADPAKSVLPRDPRFPRPLTDPNLPESHDLRQWKDISHYYLSATDDKPIEMELVFLIML